MSAPSVSAAHTPAIIDFILSAGRHSSGVSSGFHPSIPRHGDNKNIYVFTHDITIHSLSNVPHCIPHHPCRSHLISPSMRDASAAAAAAWLLLGVIRSFVCLFRSNIIAECRTRSASKLPARVCWENRYGNSTSFVCSCMHCCNSVILERVLNFTYTCMHNELELPCVHMQGRRMMTCERVCVFFAS
jgi:hypothetical protein